MCVSEDKPGHPSGFKDLVNYILNHCICVCCPINNIIWLNTLLKKFQNLDILENSYNKDIIIYSLSLYKLKNSEKVINQMSFIISNDLNVNKNTDMIKLKQIALWNLKVKFLIIDIECTVSIK